MAYPVQQSIDQRFDEFHAANPHVYEELVALARRAQARGYRNIGIELLFAQLRWSRMMQTTADAYGFKLNDHFTSRYARLIMAQEPDLAACSARARCAPRSRRREYPAGGTRTTTGDAMLATVRKTFQFHAAHQIDHHAGECRHLHGHTYTVTIEARGEVLPVDGRPDGGMVMDFGRLKDLYLEHIDEPCDHRNLNDVFDFATTAEHLATHFLGVLREQDDRICAVEVSEGPGNVARASVDPPTEHLMESLRRWQHGLVEQIRKAARRA